MDVSREAKKRLVALVEQRDEPLAALAARIGVSQSTLWNFIYGETKSFSKLHRLAGVLQISLDWIQQGERAAESPRPGQRMAEPDTAATCDDDLLRTIAQTAARLARTHERLSPAIFGAIAIAARSEAAGGAGRGASIAAAMERLAAYEDGKRRRRR